MENFTSYNPTRVEFGKDSVLKLKHHIREAGTKVLLVYGKGSIKNNGIYSSVMDQLSVCGADVYEFGGIKPNPTHTDVDSAVKIIREKKIEIILAVGGGSVIDSAKIMALCAPEDIPAWDLMTGNRKASKAITIMAVLTLAATGSEMNSFAVLQNETTMEKIGFGSPLAYPKVSFLDPTYTYSVNAEYTAYGISDLIAHCLESYFGMGTCSLSDRFVVAIIREAMHYGPLVLKSPDNYEYRSNLMWAATCALNGTTVQGKLYGDWGVHGLGHCLSLLFDMPHGASLSVFYPAWMKVNLDLIRQKLEWIGKELFGTSTAEDCIDGFENFFKSIGSPVRMPSELITDENRSKVISLIGKNRISGYVYKMDDQFYQKVTAMIF